MQFKRNLSLVFQYKSASTMARPLPPTLSELDA
jgi:hypothetical protein